MEKNILVWTGIILCLSQSAMFSGLNLAVFGIGRLRLEVEASTGNRDARAVLALHRAHVTLARGQVDEAREICARARRTLAGRGRMALQLLEQTLEARR